MRCLFGVAVLWVVLAFGCSRGEPEPVEVREPAVKYKRAADTGQAEAPAAAPDARPPARSPARSVTRDRGAASADEAPAPSAQEHRSVQVYYGTDRAHSGDPAPNDFYGSDSANRLDLGRVEINIPARHREGRVERPSIWRLQFEENPEKHVMLTDLATVEEQAWLGALRDSGASTAFVFVHGYNKSFAEAARRTGQVAWDLDFDGVPLMFSWSSKGRVVSYLRDGESIKDAEPHFRRFLELVTGVEELESVHLVAHSMGNRLVAEVLRDMALAGQDEPLLDQLVMAAPDIDAAEFARDFQATLPTLAERVTIYVSDHDRALTSSRGLHKRPRAGDLEGGVLGAEGLDTVDASQVTTDFTGHNYYADSVTILTDLHCLLAYGAPPPRRPLLRPKRKEARRWWQMLGATQVEAQALDLTTCGR